MRWFGHGVKARHVGFANGSAPLAHGQLHRSPLSRVRSVALGAKRMDQLGGDGGAGYSTVTLFARLRGWSTSVPFSTAVW